MDYLVEVVERVIDPRIRRYMHPDHIVFRHFAVGIQVREAVSSELVSPDNNRPANDRPANNTPGAPRRHNNRRRSANSIWKQRSRIRD
jgi:hypothetical protein